MPRTPLEGSERRSPGITRRDVLRYASIGALTTSGIGAVLYGTKPLPPSGLDAVMADSGVTLSKRSAKLREVQFAIDTRRDAFAARYLETQDLADLETTAVAVEWMHYLRSTPEDAVDADHFYAVVYEPFMAKLAEDYRKRNVAEDVAAHDADPQSSPSVRALTNLKLALYDQWGEEITYERSRSNIVDPLKNHHLQCRSGTKLFALAALRLVKPSLQPGERLVVIHTCGHVLPGLLKADGELIGIEMTKSGHSLVHFGALEALGEAGYEVEVLHAEHALAQDAIGAKAFQEETVLANTVKPISRAGGVGFSGYRAHADQYGFGVAEVSEGPQPIDRAEFIAPQVYQGEGGIYRQMGAASEHKDLMARLTHEEQVIVRRYMQHTNYFSSCFSRHVAVLQEIQDRPSMSESEALAVLKRADSIAGEMRSHIDKNNLLQDHKDTLRILKARRLALNFDIRSIAEQMASNHQTAMWIWAKAHAQDDR